MEYPIITVDKTDGTQPTVLETKTYGTNSRALGTLSGDKSVTLEIPPRRGRALLDGAISPNDFGMLRIPLRDERAYINVFVQRRRDTFAYIIAVTFHNVPRHPRS